MIGMAQVSTTQAGWTYGMLALLAIVSLPAYPSEAQITTNTALPVSKGETIVRLQSKLIRRTGDTLPQDRRVSVLAVPLVAVHGVGPKLALFAVVPFFSKNLDVTVMDGRVTRTARGVGDARFFARFEVFRHNRRGTTARLASFVGIDVPTGRSDASDKFGSLPRALQLGSGNRRRACLLPAVRSHAHASACKERVRQGRRHEHLRPAPA